MVGRTSLVYRQGGDEWNLLSRSLAVVHRRRAAQALGSDQSLGGRERRLPRPGDARRHAGHRLRRAAAERQFLRQESERRHPVGGAALPADERPVGRQDPRLRPHHCARVRGGQLLEHAAHRRHLPRLAAHGLARKVAAHSQHSGVARLLRRKERGRSAPLL